VSRFIDMEDSIYAMTSKNELKRDEVEVEEQPEVVKPTRQNNLNQSRAVYVTVRRGDSLGVIARRNGTTVTKIKRLNGLRSNTIRPGQRLRVK